jgi:hypothetical protein
MFVEGKPLSSGFGLCQTPRTGSIVAGALGKNRVGVQHDNGGYAILGSGSLEGQLISRAGSRVG